VTDNVTGSVTSSNRDRKGEGHRDRDRKGEGEGEGDRQGQGLFLSSCVNARAPGSAVELTDAEHHEHFERVKAAYPRFSGRQDWINAETQCRNHVGNADATWDLLLAAADRYAKHIRGKADEGTQFVKTPGRFFAGNDDDAFWRQEWPVPTPANGKSRPGAPATHAEVMAALDAAVDPNDTSEDWP
jgi:hypothetical protein